VIGIIASLSTCMAVVGGLGVGLGSYRNTVSLQNAGSQTGEQGIYPLLDLSGELWITENWFMAADLRQGVLSIPNSQAGSSPSKLNATTSWYDLNGGYKFLLQDDFWGPQINMHLGFNRYSLYVDTSSPVTFTSTAYSGIYVGLGGLMPLTSDRTYWLTVNFDRMLFPTLTESPLTSGGSANPTMTSFAIGCGYRMNIKFVIFAALHFDFYGTTYSGAGSLPSDQALSASQQITSLLSGIEYLF
jgi:hypothetical protein